MELTHINDQGRARMVDVSEKDKTYRTARTYGKILMNPDTLNLVRSGGIKKGDVLAVAQVAGIMAAKKCSDMIPMCHPIALTGCDIDFTFEPDGISFIVTTKCKGETGVEMEAMCAASVCGLTIYDMCKAVQRDMVIEQVKLLEKDGGKSGHFVRDDTDSDIVGRGKVVSCNISEKKGTRKHPVDEIKMEVGKGIEKDAHSGNWHRQVSLLGNESVDLMRAKGLELNPGDFAENILTEGIDLPHIPTGSIIEVGPVRMVVTQIGKKCHNDCEIKRLTGMCVMPTDGIFCVVTQSGVVRPGDQILVHHTR